MRKILPVTLLFTCALAASFAPERALEAVSTAKNSTFVYTNPTGEITSVPLVDDSAKRRLIAPIIQTDAPQSEKLARAATIAEERANAHSKSLCWRYVKDALLAAGAVDSRPETALAKEAGDALVRDYGFKKLPITDPYAAPVGAVIVYSAKDAPGHVEIRTKDGFVSDFRAKTPSRRPLIGVYVKA